MGPPQDKTNTPMAREHRVTTEATDGIRTTHGWKTRLHFLNTSEIKKKEVDAKALML
jgi:hypothetical protein